MKKNSFIILVFCFFLNLNIHGQISTKELPVSFSLEQIIKSSNDEKFLKVMPAINMEKIYKEDMEDEQNGIPPRFGYGHKVNYNLENSGIWTVLPNGDRIWQLEISCPKALSINLLYDKFWLPEKAKFFIYSNDKKHSIGAFTSINNKGNEKIHKALQQVWFMVIK